MNYKEALEYLEKLDTVPYCDGQFTDAINPRSQPTRPVLTTTATSHMIYVSRIKATM